jgi:LuxR family quorum-sensing system transcriptional regulator CciR
MAAGLSSDLAACAATADEFLRMLARVRTRDHLADIMAGICQELGFRHYALIHHADLRGSPAGYIRMMDYPRAIVERIIDQATWRRDPVIRASLFAGRAFLWSELPLLLHLDRRDRQCLAQGIDQGLNEGITVPYAILGRATGSCTFAGTRTDGIAEHRLGMAQMVGIFAFQAGQRLFGVAPRGPAPRPRLHPRSRDCIVLAGRGLSNKEIARSLSLTPRTVDGYLTEARRLFDAHDRTELVVSALLAGEVGFDEIARRQPE